MRIAHSQPRRPAALIIEYLVWSLAVAAVPGLYTAMWVLEADPQDIYDNQGDIVRGFVNWSTPVLMVAITPLGLGILWRTAMRVGHDLANVRRSVAVRGGQTTTQGQPVSGSAPTKPMIGGSDWKTVPWPGLRLYLEYVLLVFLTLPAFVVVGFLIGGTSGAEFAFLARNEILIIASLPGLLMAARLLLKLFLSWSFAGR